MNARSVVSRLARFILAAELAISAPARAGLLSSPGSAGILGNRITVCFVGDAVVTRSVFIQQIRNYRRGHEGVANIDYEFTGRGVAPTVDAAGLDVYTGDMRLVLSGTSVPYSPAPNAVGNRMIPGNGCTRSVPSQIDPMTRQPIRDAAGNTLDTFASFGIFPHERSPQSDTHCQWNMRLGDDGQAGTPYRNHTLHEFGHSIGFPHEFDRMDARSAIRNAPCSRNADGTDSVWFNGLPTSTTGNQLITTESYDLASTMNYFVAGCNYVGNYSQLGLGQLEKISLHFMYPEDVRVAEYLGRTTLRTGENTVLTGLWQARGASFSRNPMIISYSWRINGQVVGSSSAIHVSFASAGDRVLELSYIDFANRNYSYRTTLRVLTPDNFTRRILAAASAAFPQ